MKRLILAFLAGVAAGAAGFWYLQQEQNQQQLRAVGTSVTEGAGKVRDAVTGQVGAITVESVRKELEHSGMVVREKAGKAGSAIADVTANARVTAAVKARLLSELGMAGMHVNVDTTDGLVTLSGTAASHDDVAKAMKIALETEGVRKVISTLQVKAAAPPTGAGKR